MKISSYESIPLEYFYARRGWVDERQADTLGTVEIINITGTNGKRGDGKKNFSILKIPRIKMDILVRF